MKQRYRHLTLGVLIEKLNKLPANCELSYDFASVSPSQLNSYRGYHEQLALGHSERRTTVGVILDLLRRADSMTFGGYKGGLYEMDSSTPLWCANWGECPGYAITGLYVWRDGDGIARRAWLMTEYVDGDREAA